MIHRIKLLKNIGLFDSVTGNDSPCFRKLTLVFAENGRGKTTLTAVLRSLATGSPQLIKERHRLGSHHIPHVVIEYDDGTHLTVYQNHTWSRPNARIIAFDDIFVNDHVYSGLEVTPEHRQNLHGLIIGSQGVELARNVGDITNELSRLQSILREKANEIPQIARGQLTVDQFCALAPIDNIDEEIEDVTRRIAALQQNESVERTPFFAPIVPPPIEIIPLQDFLRRGLTELDTCSLEAMKSHCDKLGEGAEKWIARGTQYEKAIHDAGTHSCPYCDQPLGSSHLVSQYRAYFSDAYVQHKRTIDEVLSNTEKRLGGDAIAQFP